MRVGRLLAGGKRRSVRAVRHNGGMARRPDSLLAHFIARAAAVWIDGEPTPWGVVKITPRASRLAGFAILWAASMRELGVDELSPETYATLGYDSRATTYRRLHEYGELFPDLSIDDLGRLILATVDRKTKLRDASKVTLRLPVAA